MGRKKKSESVTPADDKIDYRLADPAIKLRGRVEHSKVLMESVVNKLERFSKADPENTDLVELKDLAAALVNDQLSLISSLDELNAAGFKPKKATAYIPWATGDDCRIADDFVAQYVDLGICTATQLKKMTVKKIIDGNRKAGVLVVTENGTLIPNVARSHLARLA